MDFTMKHFLILSPLILILFSCKPEPPTPPATPSLTNDGVFILNEGNFQAGNASLDFYDLETDTIFQGVFELVNGRKLGDVLQSMTVVADKAYLVVNNSQKIEVVNFESLESAGTISGLTSPRHMLAINDSIAYVSDLYAGGVHYLNLNTQSVLNLVAVPGWTEELVRKGDQVILANYDYAYLSKIDLETNIGSSLTQVPPRGQHLLIDANGDLWLATGASLTDNAPGHLVHIDGETFEIISDFEFPAGQSPSRLTYNGTRDSLFWLNQGVFSMPITANELPASPLIEEDGTFYGLGVDPVTSELFVADAIDYVQRGVILRYSAGGTLIKEFRSGVIPGSFYFKRY